MDATQAPVVEGQQQQQPQGQPAPAPAPVATAVPTQAPTPAPAPAAATPTPAPVAAKADDPPAGQGKFGPVIAYAPTGNANLDAAVKWLGAQGIDIETLPGYAEAKDGDFAQIKAHLAGLGIPGAEAYAALAESGFNARREAEQARQRDIQALIAESAGGDSPEALQGWADALDFIRANTEDAEGLKQREQINKLLDMGGLATKLVADFIMAQYRQQPNVSTGATRRAVTDAAAAGGAVSGNGPLSRAAYAQAVEQLRRDNPGQQIEGSDQYAELQRRRLLGQRNGI